MAQAKFSPPGPDQHPEYFAPYVERFQPEDFLSEYENQATELRDVLGGLSDEQASEVHEPYSWTLKQMVGHLIDTERIFGNRLLRIAVGDTQEMPGMDQNQYVDNQDFRNVSMGKLLDEFHHLRQSNALLANRLSAESLDKIGNASGNQISARSKLFLTAGHVAYHIDIAKKRLGIG